MVLDWTLVAVGGLFLILGFVGCVVPCLPGPLLGWCALLSIAFSRFAIPTAWLVVAGVVMAVATVLDYVVPAYGAKTFDCSRWGVIGCAIGTIAGMFFFPLGIILGPFLGAFLAELLANRSFGQAMMGGLGAFLGFLFGVFLKLVAVGVFAGFFVWGLTRSW